jgi:hypothetical protein
MSRRPERADANYRLLESLSRGEKVGIDAEGRLYKIGEGAEVNKVHNLALQGLLQTGPRLTPTSSSIENEAISQAAFNYVLDKMATFNDDLAPNQDNYLKLMESMSHLLTAKDKEFLVFHWYDKQFKALCEKGKSENEAEGMITVEMSVDPNLSSAHRDKIAPTLATTGLSGTYFVKNRQGKPIAVVKPRMQEVGMPLNPKGHAEDYDERNPGRMQHAGHVQGTSFLNEVLASKIGGKFFNIPTTTKVTMRAPYETGGVKWFTESDECSYQFFSEGTPYSELDSLDRSLIPQSEWQRLVIFDLLNGQMDRNKGNILVKDEVDKTTKKIVKRLVYIDHGLCFPDNLDWRKPLPKRLEAYTLFCTDAPLDKDLAKWISKYDIEAACKMLRESGKSEGSIRHHRIMAKFLKLGVEAGMEARTLRDMVVPPRGHRNVLFDIVSDVQKKVGMEASEPDFMKEFERLMKLHFDVRRLGLTMGALGI